MRGDKIHDPWWWLDQQLIVALLSSTFVKFLCLTFSCDSCWTNSINSTKRSPFIQQLTTKDINSVCYTVLFLKFVPAAETLLEILPSVQLQANAKLAVLSLKCCSLGDHAGAELFILVHFKLRSWHQTVACNLQYLHDQGDEWQREVAETHCCLEKYI